MQKTENASPPGEAAKDRDQEACNRLWKYPIGDEITARVRMGSNMDGGTSFTYCMKDGGRRICTRLTKG